MWQHLPTIERKLEKCWNKWGSSVLGAQVSSNLNGPGRFVIRWVPWRASHDSSTKWDQEIRVGSCSPWLSQPHDYWWMNVEYVLNQYQHSQEYGARLHWQVNLIHFRHSRLAFRCSPAGPSAVPCTWWDSAERRCSDRPWQWRQAVGVVGGDWGHPHQRVKMAGFKTASPWTMDTKKNQ